MTCNSYKKCCYTIAAPEPTLEPEDEGSSVTLSDGGTLSTNGTMMNTTSTQRLSAGDTTRTCVGGHTGSTVGAAANILRDPSHPQFCQLLSSSNRAGITPTVRFDALPYFLSFLRAPCSYQTGFDTEIAGRGRCATRWKSSVC